MTASWGRGTRWSSCIWTTGYLPGHPALPIGLDYARQFNFVSGADEDPSKAVDKAPPEVFLTNRGHGTATLGILAGNKLMDLQLPGGNSSDDHLGGAPLAHVVPVRIADAVVHFWTSRMAAGIDYARRIGADVVSVSMGGYLRRRGPML